MSAKPKKTTTKRVAATKAATKKHSPAKSKAGPVKQVAHKSKKPAKPAKVVKKAPLKPAPSANQPKVSQPNFSLPPFVAKLKYNYLNFALAAFTIIFLVVFLGLRSQAKSVSPTRHIIQVLRHPLKHSPKPMYPLFFKLGQVQTNVSYCNGQTMDLYYPRRADQATVPVVFYLHGGGWEINNKSSEPDQLAIIDGLRDHGIMIASIDYRKMPEAYFPAPVEDALCAVRYIRANSKTYAIDSQNIGMHGFSAGGYLAAMVGTLAKDSPLNKGAFDQESSRIQAVSTLAAVLDLNHHVSSLNTDRNSRFLRGANINDASPINHISSDDPPFLLIHGAQDQYVSTAQDDAFAERLRNSSVKNDIILVAHAEHGLNPSGGDPKPSKTEISQRLIQFYTQSFGRQ